ncbi:hypothetical protein COOONC_26886 [Cooperia oncophora]
MAHRGALQRRHNRPTLPPERMKSANGRDRIIKIELPSQALRDKLLHHMRSGRQSLTRRFVHSYARRDYTSEELELDRTLRKQAGIPPKELSIEAILIHSYRNAPRTTSGTLLGPIEASLLSTPYIVYRCDRDGDTPGGGVLAMIRDDISSSLISSICFSVYLQCIVLRISLFSNDCIFILCYRSRSCSAVDFQKLLLYVEELCLNKVPVVILGDFNFFDPMSLSKSRLSRQGSLFINFVESHSFTQTVLEPTHGRNILDLVLTNSPHIIGSTSVQAPFSTSDHATVTFTLSTIHSQPVSKPILNFAKGDYGSIRRHLLAID